MARRFCLSCGGRYSTTDAAGIQYFHSCPPVVVVRVARGGATLDVAVHDQEPGDTLLGFRDVARANARDENVMASGAEQGKPKHEGHGVLEADDDAALDTLIAQTPAAAAAVSQGAPKPAPAPATPAPAAGQPLPRLGPFSAAADGA